MNKKYARNYVYSTILQCLKLNLCFAAFWKMLQFPKKSNIA